MEDAVNLNELDSRIKSMVGPKEAAAIIECSVSTLYRWIAEGTYAEILKVYKGRTGRTSFDRDDCLRVKAANMLGMDAVREAGEN